MKKISNFLLASLLILVMGSPAISQDNPAPIGNNSSQNFDGPGFPTIEATTTVLPGNGSTSGNGRAPQGSRRFINTKYIITGPEMTTSGFSGVVTSVGWRWNVPSPPAATGPIAQSVTTTGSLRVYLRDTVAGAITIGSTFIDTNGTGYTKIIDGTITIPAGLAEINIDVPVGGPGTSSFAPTPGNGVLLIFVYKTTDVGVATPLGSPNVFCTNAGGGAKLATFQSQTVGGSAGASSSFRPETRFGSPSVPIDVGISASNLLNGRIYSVGKSYDFTATVRNTGTDTQTVVGVSYTLNGGAPVGPVNTVGPIAEGGTENVTFSGGNALTGLIKGVNTIKIYTSLAGDTILTNDTLTVILNVLNKIIAYPYIQTFSNPVGWTTLVENAVGATPLWGLGICTNPDGKVPDTAATSNCFSGARGRKEVLRSPEMDLTGLTNPILNFYSAYRTFATENDSLEVLVSTDAGLTFFSASTVYNKGRSSVPSLATRPPSTTIFFPDSAKQWRHETISLANVAGFTNVVIGFRSKSDFGNRQWVDNVIVSDADGLCTDAVVAPGSYNCNSLLTIDFNTVGLKPMKIGNQSDNVSGIMKTNSDRNIVGSFASQTGNVNVISNNQTDNPTGGTLAVAEYDNDATVQGLGVQNLTGATAPDATVFTPDVVYQDFWFNVTYTGNDYLGYATYDINIDISSIVFNNPGKVYIVKRTDRTGLWNTLNTTLSGGMLSADYAFNTDPLSTFSDFALAGDSITNPLPVELSSFVSIINRRDVTLNWTTASELNNAGFDIERSIVNPEGSGWSMVGNVSGHGTSTAPNSYSYTDRNLASGKYNYRLKQIDLNGNFTYYELSNEVNVGVPTKFDLSQNYPNPFNPSTKINYDLPFDGKVSVKIFDMAGKEVSTLVNEVKTAGYYTINFNATNLSSGVYFYRISAEANGQNFVSTKKMMLVK
ncbi:MAG: T9SS type A sorting domain-containing protein [Bacteroidota bacterium]|nr:T9SS type A sorting domain-containing protein [Bacteroidota bacterium]